MLLKTYSITLPIFLAIDMIWLVFVAKSFYSKQIGFLMKTNVNWIAAMIFYLLFTAGLVVFVIAPSIEKKSWNSALLIGAFFGLITYATYDLTNLSTIKNWSLLVTVVDIVWGMFLSATVSTISYFITMRFFK